MLEGLLSKCSHWVRPTSNLCVCVGLVGRIGLASATSQRSNHGWRSNRQNWFLTRTASLTKACWEIVGQPKNGPECTCPIPNLLICDAISCERVVKHFRSLYERIKSFDQRATCLPACFLSLEPIFPVATRFQVFWRYHLQALWP